MTIGEALRAGQAALKDIDGGARDARWLLAAALGVGRDRLTLLAADPMPLEALSKYEVLLAGRAERRPVSHLTGERDFYGRRFEVTPDALDPRPETETLVAAALEAPFKSMLDLGTGTGAIMLTLLAERGGATGIGTDLSPAALALAGRNATALGVADRVTLLTSNWFEAVSGAFDLVVSNPPYIAVGEMRTLDPELAHEPRMALTDEGDGLSAYRAIFAGAARHLAPRGRVIVEFGAGQGPDVAAIAQAEGWADTAFRADLSGKHRVLVAKAPQ